MCQSSSEYYSPLAEDCVSTCPLGSNNNRDNRLCECCTGYFDSGTRQCVTTYPEGKFADPSIRVCVRNCPAGFTEDPEARVCVCTGGEVFDPTILPSTNDTAGVATCSASTTANTETHQCECNDGTYLDSVETPKVCVGACISCGGEVVFANPETNECSLECPTGTTPNPTTHLCVCPAGTYWDEALETCADCPAGPSPIPCQTCTAAGCLTCPPKAFLFNGDCWDPCPTGTFEDTTDPEHPTCFLPYKRCLPVHLHNLQWLWKLQLSILWVWIIFVSRSVCERMSSWVLERYNLK